MTFISECLLIFLIIFFVNLFFEIFFLICSFKNFFVWIILQYTYFSYSFLFVFSIVWSCFLLFSLIKSDFLLKMSAQLLFFFLQYWMIKSYFIRISAHCACHSFNFFIIIKYCRFLWFNLMIIWYFIFNR